MSPLTRQELAALPLDDFVGVNAVTGAAIRGEAHLAQSVRDVLTTPFGAEVMARGYGAGVFDRMDAPVTAELGASVVADVAVALDAHEPRARLTQVLVPLAGGSLLDLGLILARGGEAVRVAGLRGGVPMSGGFASIDLSQLPPPNAVEPLDHAAIFAEMKAELIDEAPELAPVLSLDSEPLTKWTRVQAYRELVSRNRINLAFQAVTLAFAGSADLDHRAADRGVLRFADESDDAFRARVALAPEGFSVAGPFGAYYFHAQSADPRVADVAVDSPTPGQARVVVLAVGETGNGAASAALVPVVEAALSAEDVRPFLDQVVVLAPTLIVYNVALTLTVKPGPDAALLTEAARAAALAYAAERRRLGRDVRPAGFVAAGMQPGVSDATVALTRNGAPVAAIAVGPREAAVLGVLTVTVGGSDD